MVNAQQYPPKTLNNIPMLNNIRPPQASLNNLERSTISGKSAQQSRTLNSYSTQQYLALNNIWFKSAQQYPVKALNNIQQRSTVALNNI